MTTPGASGLPARRPEGHGLLRGRIAAITAAAGTGIGSAIAERFAQEGAIVAISDIHAARLARAADELHERTGHRPLAVPCDVTVPGAIDDFFDTVERTLGPLDVVVNNAGLGGESTLCAMTDEAWDRVLAVTLTSAFFGTRAAMRRMLPRGRGCIVNLASVTGWRAEAGQSHYGAAKAGVMALSRCAAMEAAPHGVRVNAVAPTIATHPILLKRIDPAVLAHWEQHQPHRRAAETHEIASVVAFAASDYASYLTGEVISASAQHP